MFGDSRRAEPFSRFRSLEDVRELRALAHPIRIALMDELAVNGPMTATEAAERVGETPTTCSFHLRQLAKFGFVEEAGGGKGRARPWRLVHGGMRIDPDHVDPEIAFAAGATARLARDRALTRYRTWIDTRHGYPEAWRRAAEETDLLLWLTPDELHELTAEVERVIEARIGDRRTDPSQRPPGALPVEVVHLAFPLQPPRQA